MGNSFVLLDVFIVISHGQFHCGNRDRTQNTDLPWVKSHFPVGKRSSIVEPQLMIFTTHGCADKPNTTDQLQNVCEVLLLQSSEYSCNPQYMNHPHTFGMAVVLFKEILYRVKGRILQQNSTYDHLYLQKKKKSRKISPNETR